MLQSCRKKFDFIESFRDAEVAQNLVLGLIQVEELAELSEVFV